MSDGVFDGFGRRWSDGVSKSMVVDGGGVVVVVTMIGGFRLEKMEIGAGLSGEEDDDSYYKYQNFIFPI